MCRDCEVKTCKELPRLGVRLDFLERFIKDHNIQPDWTTEKVVQDIIKRYTMKHQRFTDYIEHRYPEEGYVGPKPSVFISHAWSRPFVELVTSLSRGRVYGRSNRKKYVWLDIFTVHQHPGKFQQMDLRTITECIRTIGYTVVILDNGISPEKFTLTEEVKQPVALSRIWCLSEIWNTIRYGGEVQLISSGILFGGVGRCGWFTRRPFEVSCLNAKATKKEDLSRILAEMEHAETVCNDPCAGHPLTALPYDNVVAFLEKARPEQKNDILDTTISCIKCGRSGKRNFKYYVLFCKSCKKTLLCRDCWVSKTTMITLVDKTINDGILRLWAEQRFYLIYVVLATLCIGFGGVYGIKRTFSDNEDTVTTAPEAMVLGVLYFLVVTMFLISFSVFCNIARMARFHCLQLSEVRLLVLYVSMSAFLVLLYYLAIFDEEYHFASYTILSFCLCFLVVLCAILYLYRKRSLTRNFRMNITPGSWTWFFLFCWCYYPNCLSWILCDCVWIKGYRHKGPRKLCKNMEALCYALLKPCRMCFSCGKPRGISVNEGGIENQRIDDNIVIRT